MYKNINEELGIKEDSDIDTGDIADITEANSLGNCHLDEPDVDLTFQASSYNISEGQHTFILG